MFGVARSPKLVKRKGTRPAGAVRTEPGTGVAPLRRLSAVTTYEYPVSGRSPVITAWYVHTVSPFSPSVYARACAAITSRPPPRSSTTRGRIAAPGDAHDTTTLVAGSFPQVRCTCSGVPSLRRDHARGGRGRRGAERPRAHRREQASAAGPDEDLAP